MPCGRCGVGSWVRYGDAVRCLPCAGTETVPKGKPEVESALGFLGMDLCDGCGAPLERGGHLAGLCPA